MRTKWTTRQHLAGVEPLEARTLMAAQAPSLIAIMDTSPNAREEAGKRAVAYYDVSDIAGYSGTDFFDNTPLFYVWSGFEQTVQKNYEEPQALTVNPANGDTYMLAFDAGSTPGDVDGVGDTEGDYDLYRFDITKIYTDFITNGRARGVMYAPAVTSDGLDLVNDFYGGDNTPPLAAGDLGMPTAGRDNTDASPSNDVIFIGDAIHKVGEVARRQSENNFFDYQDLQFVDANTLLLMENDTNGTADTDDFSIRTLERVAGPASPKADNTGGYTGGTESWESFAWSGDNYVRMDAPGNLSEVDGMRYVERDGVRGVWVSDDDTTFGDEYAFFKLDFATRTAEKQELYDATLGYAPFNAFKVDEDPTVSQTSNDGETDFFDVDENGKLILIESDFADGAESRIFTHSINDYGRGDVDGDGRGEIEQGAWTVNGRLRAADGQTLLDDDTNATLDTRYGVFHRGQDYVYFFDIDSFGTTDDAPGSPSTQYYMDAYVVDANTGEVVYQELDAVNLWAKDANGIRAFTLGDYAIIGDSMTSHDGIVDAADIDALYARIQDPTMGGRFSAAVGAETFDLTGDNLLTGGNPAASAATVAGDMDFLIRRLLGTEYGDTNLDGFVDSVDLSRLRRNLGGATATWANGNLNGDLFIDSNDLSLLRRKLGFVAV
jgi:hypothetical protein